MMLGYLLARAGVSVAVLEKHGDFLRDFRGDTVHPSTLEVMDELGLLDRLLQHKHSEVPTIAGQVGKDSVTIGNFSGVPGRCKFVALMPQWDFLNFLSDEAKRYPEFHLLMNTEATGVIQEWGRVVGVQATSADGLLEIRSDLVVATDGRHSTMRSALGVQPRDIGAPMDVLWFRISREPSDRNAVLGFIGEGAILVALNRDDYWQIAYVIAKGTLDAVRAQGLEAFHQKIERIAPFLASRVHEVKNWDDIKLLEVKIDRLEKWYRPGILFIGDAAHAMSPIGGVGINLAIQDAVATANLLAPAFCTAAPVSDDVLAKVQARREWPTVMTQRMQVLVQKRVISRVLASTTPPEHAPWPLQMLSKMPLLQRIPARIVGVGFRPEHVAPFIRRRTPPSVTPERTAP